MSLEAMILSSAIDAKENVAVTMRKYTCYWKVQSQS